ncbi:hypothetical protein [Methylogaea oryzae]|nr:hypothetical protein [Methylogaea oryzae]
MHTIQLKILDARLGNDIPLPHYATAGAAGWTCAPAWTSRWSWRRAIRS